MSTGVETWVDAHALGATYPFPGSEGLLVIVGMALWVGWHIWQLANEARELNKENDEIKDKARLSQILESKKINSNP